MDSAACRSTGAGRSTAPERADRAGALAPEVEVAA
jgi:hypothetical protein